MDRGWKPKKYHWACKDCLVRPCCREKCADARLPFEECPTFCPDHYQRCVDYDGYYPHGCFKIQMFNRIIERATKSLFPRIT